MRRSARSNTALFRAAHGNQADLSTLQDAARKTPRISRAQPYARRAQGAAESPRPRSSAYRVVVVDAAREKRYGLSPARRLRRKAEFERLLRQGKRLSIAGYTFFIERRAAGRPRLGMLISRRHAAAATERNRLKRCIREAFRLEQEKLGSIDVLVRPPYGQKASAQMTLKLRDMFGRLEP